MKNNKIFIHTLILFLLHTQILWISNIAFNNIISSSVQSFLLGWWLSFVLLLKQTYISLKKYIHIFIFTVFYIKHFIVRFFLFIYLFESFSRKNTFFHGCIPVGQIFSFLLVVPIESRQTTSNFGVPIENCHCTISLFPLHFSPLWLQIKKS